MRPDIGFERRNVEVADRDHRAPVAVTVARAALDATEVDRWVEQGKTLDYEAVVQEILAADNM